MDIDPHHVEETTRRWLERAVIGLNLCPFAKAVHVKGQVHFAVSAAVCWKELLADFEREVDALLAFDAAERDTTLLMAPRCLEDFFEFNALVTEGERLLAQRGLDGTLQLASFHPRFQFAGTEADDITNATNRAPYPTLHLLREASVDRAVQAFPDASAIYETNMATLRRLGQAGWDELMKVEPR
jgi:uncharacterized protein